MTHLDGPAIECAAGDGTRPEHALHCAACAEQLDAVAAERARYYAAHPPGALIAEVRARASHHRVERLRRAAFGGGLGVALVAAAALFVVVRPSPEVRVRGTATLFTTYAQRDGETFVVGDGQALRAGDRLSFAYACEGARYLLLLGVAEDGTIIRYYPAEGARPEPLPAGRGQLPVGLRLDDQRGLERLVAVFGRDPPAER
jgi:hypothetical protein